MSTPNGLNRAGPPKASPANSNVPPFVTGVLGRCPRCGSGRLFNGFLTLAPKCTACDLDYAFIDAGDGPAVFVILIVGFIVMAAALYTEVTFRPPIWLHMTLWLPLVVALSLGLLRPMKGLMVALQFVNRAREGRLASKREITPVATALKTVEPVTFEQDAKP